MLITGLPGIIRAIEVDTAYFTGNYSPQVSIYGTNLSASVVAQLESTSTTTTTTTTTTGLKIIDQLLHLRHESIIKRSDQGNEEHSRIGLCASVEEMETVSQLDSDHWSVIVPLTVLGAGYEATRKNIFYVSYDDTITHIRVNMGPDGGEIE